MYSTYACGSPAPATSDAAQTADSDAAGDAASDSAADATGPAPTDAANDTAPGDAAPGDIKTAADADGGPATDTGEPGDAQPTDAAPAKCQSDAECAVQNPCLLGTCAASGVCTAVAKADATPCDDGNACTTQDSCASGQCSGAGALSCDDQNTCTTDVCNPFGGCLHLPAAASTACDDGDPCSNGDTCQAGKCVAGINVCQCQTSADCGKYEDGDLCNGTLYCDKSAGPPYVCKLNPASVVVCPVGANSPCQKNVCVPATGSCKLVLGPTNTPCDDGDSCTQGDFCDQGLCQGGTNTCYCKQDADCAAAEDGNLCNGTLFCNKATSQCQVNPTTVVQCKTVDDTECQKNTCNPKEGKCFLIPVHEGKACDDGNACTPNEVCVSGACTTATNTCECQNDQDCAKKEDGNLCNGTLYCDVTSNHCVVNPATVVTCDVSADPACLQNTCDPTTGACKQVALPKDGTPCEDGNPCTPASHCQSGQCQAQVNICPCQKDSECAGQEDGNLCNGTLYCDLASHVCAINPATVVECPSAFDEQCIANVCDPATGVCGMQPVHQGNQCEDGNVCSSGGWCALGTCAVEVKQACECTATSDCEKFEDGDACNGTLYCDVKAKKPHCALNPATVVVCPSGGDTACTKNLCAKGVCAMTPVAGTCSDDLACTSQDACLAGACLGIALGCDDGDACTTDLCQEPQGCVHLAFAATACDDSQVCTTDACDSKLGCQHTYTDGVCDDGLPCTVGDQCSQGACAGKPINCDDQNPCTDDSCDAKLGCQHPANSAPCSDGNVCTAGDTCKGGKCTAGPAKNCDDGNPCTDEGCDPKLGCASVTNTAPCDDGNACTAPDACSAGSCSGKAMICQDNNPCTDDGCSAGECLHGANSAPCSDGNACTKGDACSGGLCKNAGLLDCDDKNVCTADSCDATSGCVHVAAGSTCDDGNACTVQDACKSGVCAGINQTCDDNNPCTADTCDSATGCNFANQVVPCTDSNPCTQNDLCAGGKCVPGPAPDCDDADFCTADSCDTQTGKCVHVDASAKVCSDGKICTDDACNGQLGCQHTYNTTACEDGDKCTSGDVCSFGVCKSGPFLVCDDKNGCTDDSCDPKVGCVFAPNTTPCDDGNGCTLLDVCNQAQCKGVLSCDDKNPCTDDSCNFVTAKCVYANNADPCDDGDACTSLSHCKGGVCLPEVASPCDDGNVCTDNSCDKVKGCQFAPNTAACVSGSCTEEDVCSAGTCKSDPNKPRYWDKGMAKFGTSSGEGLLGVAPTSDGVVAVGRGTQNVWSAPAHSLFLHAGRGGSTFALAEINTDLPGPVLTAVVNLGDGTYGAMGYTSENVPKYIVERLASNGTVLWSKVMTTPGQSSAANLGTGASAHPNKNGEFVACGYSTCNCGAWEHGVLFAYGSDGTQLAATAYDPPDPQRFYACAFVTPKLIATAGLTADSTPGAGGFGNTDGEIAFFEYPSLKFVRNVRLGTSDGEQFRTLAVGPNGTVWAAGDHNSAPGRWLAHVSVDGQVLLNISPPSAVELHVGGLVALPDDTVVLAGRQGPDWGGFLQVWRVDETGKILSTVAGGTNMEYMAPETGAIVRDDTGALVVVGQAKPAGKENSAWIMRMDPWANKGCVNGCGTKSWDDCSDGDPCTTEACSGTCSHTPHSNSCDDGNVCTTGETCTGGKCVGSDVVCNDFNPCTLDSCDVKLGCQTAAYPEGFVCATGKTCQSGLCK